MVAAPPFLWTREGFLRAAEAGAFGESGVELLDGGVYEVISESHPHRIATMLLLRALSAAFGERFLVRSEMGLPLGSSQPKPDVSVIRWDPDSLRQRDEGAEDVALIVEVVATRPDTAELKHRIYAGARVPIYWILNVESRSLSVFESPNRTAYMSSRTFAEDESVIIAGATILVADLLP